MAALQRDCGTLTWLQPREGWEFEYGYMDFITTLRAGLVHEEMTCVPTEDANALWPVGTLVDAPALSAVYPLRFTCDHPDRFHVSSMPHETVTRHTNGTLLLDGTVPAFGRVPEKLEGWVGVEIVRAYQQLLTVRPFRRRGAKCASVSLCVPDWIDLSVG